MKKIQNTIKNSLILGCFILGVNTMANQNTLQQELNIYTAIKYNAQFSAQTQKGQQDIANEYQNMNSLSNVILQSDLKNDMELNIALKNIAITIWSNRFVQQVPVSDEEIKKLFSAQEIFIGTIYKLKNILVLEEKEADEILKTLKSFKEKNKIVETFETFVTTKSIDLQTKNNKGDIGWVDFDKLHKNIQDALLHEVSSNGVFKVYIENIGWQVILIEEVKKKHKATLEEIKPILINTIKQQKLQEEINKILSKK